MMPPTEYERAEADPARRRDLRREELILEVTEALTAAMEEAGVTRAELARRMDRTRGHVTQLLAGGRNLTLGSLAEIADAIGCKIEVNVVGGKRFARFRRARAGSARPFLYE
jgi:transcriptional regulator with XRE-family HTH domain